MKIALVSLDQVWEDKLVNQLRCQDYIEQASKFEVELVIFPEMTLTGFSMNTKLIGERLDLSPTIKFFIQQAMQNSISIAFGVVIEMQEKATNNLIVIDKSGILVANYAKIHPFSFSGENNYYSAGNELITAEMSDATIGLTICYDLRFPEIFQVLSSNCNLIITIASWPENRLRHWKSLLQARAVENQLFMVGVNRSGIDGNKLNYVKSSLVFDPMGENLEPMHSFNDMDVYDIPLKFVQLVRSSFPVKQDRKTEFYKLLL